MILVFSWFQDQTWARTMLTILMLSAHSTLITETMAELAKYREDIHTKIIPYSETSTSQLTQELQLLANKLEKDMLDAKDRSTEYLGELKAMVEQNSDDVRNRVSAYTNKLRKRLIKDTEEIRK